ncbi:MAG: LysM peptidoglycan-binding domain-containing protein [Bacteroidetes bacterium]|nr:LysM peptidoglycan-binding domain-containing protein [Bacteroidota bacterium]MDA1267582.1 LysM peptidoglycan-binding domain-containing protein [Bacteroidota bacterium]
MKNIIFRVFVASVACLLSLNPKAFSQESRLANSSQLDVILPSYHYEFIPDFTFEEVEERIQKMELDMDFELNDRVFSFIQYFTVRNRDYIKMVLARKEQYFPMYEETMKGQGMPVEIQHLSIIESGLDPKIKSRVGAMGLWQFMPATGREYGMQVNPDIDDRMDPEKSTEAAAKYLKVLYKMFGDWEVALAAYNCGPGNVQKAIRKSGGKNTFWGIYNFLPKETRNYVPQFQAMLYILNHLEEHNLRLEEPSYPLEYEYVNFDRALHLERLASLSDICLNDLEKLNPSINKGYVPESNRSMSIRVPKTKAFFIKENLAWLGDSIGKSSPIILDQKTISTAQNTSGPTSTRIIYKVRSGDTLGKIASRHGISLEKLKEWNKLKSTVIQTGQVLYIFAKGQAATTETTSRALVQNTSNSTDPKTYTVKRGDSLWNISQKYSLSIDQIKRLNNLNSTIIKPGQRLIVS